MKRGLVWVALVGLTVASALYLLLRPSRESQPPPPSPPGHPSVPRLVVGVDDDRLKWTSDPLAVVRRERSLGADAVRVWVPWHGEVAAGSVRRTELARAERAATRTSVVLAVFGLAKRTPATAASRARFCGYARSALAAVPNARAVVLWNEANSPAYWRGSSTEYERLLARCYDVLHALRPGITVLDSTASAHAPGAFLGALGAAYRASGRKAPLVDAFGHNPYPRSSREEPWAIHATDFLGEGDYSRLVAVLDRAFDGTAQRSRAIWYLEDGFQTDTSGRRARAYRGRENAVTVDSVEQADRVRAAILIAACQPDVRAFFNFELVDERRLRGWQSGLFWGTGGAKPAAAAFARASALVRSGDVDCGSRIGAAAGRP
jgi:hypothetical protein